ncbi:MAG: Gfo/Idh/MocA family oxidoreductase [Gemmatimonadaceae bacterium]|nr:Gfo/Idh/MocA family oxidoreductase [Gemmatimonadaceae bacterium]
MSARQVDDVLKVGIAGYGTVGRIRHQFCTEHPQLNVVAVCDQSFSVPVVTSEGVRCWGTYDQLLEEELDVLFVCLPNYLAPVVTVAGLEAGLHVFCEKPPGRDLGDIERVIAVEKRCPGQKLMFGFNHRYHDSVRDALRVIKSGELGGVLNLRGVYGKSKIIRFGNDKDWRTQRELAGGGILLDQGIHMVDMMRLFAGEFTDIHSFISNDYWHHDIEDNAYALMRTADGIVGMLHSSATQWRHRFQLDITLEQGAILLGGILSSTRSYGAETITIVYSAENDGGDPREVMTRYNEDHSWRDEVYDFAASVLDDKPITAGSSAEALKTMQLVYRIYCADPEWREQFGLTDRIAGKKA